MEKKKFNRGTMTGGIVRIAIALVAIIVLPPSAVITAKNSFIFVK